jgi:hypothetical protein
LRFPNDLAGQNGKKSKKKPGQPPKVSSETASFATYQQGPAAHRVPVEQGVNSAYE